MSKKIISKEEKARIYLRELEEVLDEKDMSIITTIFGVIKRSVGEDYYFDVINACCEKILESKKLGGEFEPGVAVREIYSETGFTRSEIIPILSLPREEQSYYDENEMYVTAIRNKIFKEIFSGREKEEVAKRYSTTKEIVEEIYNEELENYIVEDKTKKYTK